MLTKFVLGPMGQGVYNINSLLLLYFLLCAMHMCCAVQQNRRLLFPLFILCNNKFYKINHKMPIFTPQMESEYADLIHEAAHVTSGATIRRAYRGTIKTLRALYESDPNWIARTPSCFVTLEHTWLMTMVTEIARREDSDRWLNHQYEKENFQHQLKTPARMEEIASISGLARIMFTSTVNKQWISPLVKAYWYALAWEPRDRELPHRESTVLSSGHHVTVFPSFTEAA